MSRRIVLVTWADAHADTEGTWVAIDEIEDDGEYIITSVGIVLETGEGGKAGHLTIAQNISPDEQADHILNIPDGMVRSVVTLGAVK